MHGERAADDFDLIRKRLEELKREREEAAKGQPQEPPPPADDLSKYALHVEDMCFGCCSLPCICC